MDQMDRDRLLRLQRAAKQGGLIRTKQGVFESNSCCVCGFHHRISLLLKDQQPCPGTEAGVKYYTNHGKERQVLESFVLNKGMKVAECITSGKERKKQASSKYLYSTCSGERQVVELEESVASLSNSKHSNTKQTHSKAPQPTASLPELVQSSSERRMRSPTAETGKKFVLPYEMGLRSPTRSGASSPKAARARSPVEMRFVGPGAAGERVIAAELRHVKRARSKSPVQEQIRYEKEKARYVEERATAAETRHVERTKLSETRHFERQGRSKSPAKRAEMAYYAPKETILKSTPRSESPERPKEQRKKVPRRRKVQSPLGHHVGSSKATDKSGKKQPSAPNDISWRDVFVEAGLGSFESSEGEGSEKDAESLKIQLMREMYTQEEEALRFRLAREKEKHRHNMK